MFYWLSEFLNVSCWLADLLSVSCWLADLLNVSYWLADLLQVDEYLAVRPGRGTKTKRDEVRARGALPPRRLTPVHHERGRVGRTVGTHLQQPEPFQPNHNPITQP